MLIKAKLTRKDYTKALLTRMFSSTGGKIFLAVIVAFLLSQIVMAIIYPADFPSMEFMIALMVCVVTPFSIWNALRKAFSNNQRMSETIEYRFDDQYLHVTGESFRGQLTWDKVYKVVLYKDWLYIWQSKPAANIIPKRDLPEGCIERLKEILDNHQVKYKL